MIGRLAVAKYQVGEVLLMNASSGFFDSANRVGSSTVAIDALDEVSLARAAHGLVRLPDSLRLVLLMRMAAGG